MFRSIFQKIFTLHLSVIILTFGLLSLLLARAFGAYFIEQKTNSLIRQGERISTQYARVAVGRIGNLYDLYNELQEINAYLDASFMLLDTGFRVIDASLDVPADMLGKRLETDIYNDALRGQVVTVTGSVGGAFPEQALSVCYPVVVGKTVICMILMNSSLPELKKAVGDVYKIIGLCMGASAAMAFVLAFVSSKTLSRPLKAMSEAAKIISEGDFKKRLDAKSRDEVGALARSLNNMAESLNAQEQARRDFLANISHDFRSPLTSVRGFLQAIEDGTIPPEEHPRYIGVVLEETERLSRLADDILTLNTFNFLSRGLDKTEFALNDLINQCAETFARRASEKNIALTVSAGEAITVKADFAKIERVLYNLTDNAIKFTPQGGGVRISARKQGQKACVAVSDTGSGVPQSDRARVFERFYKADASRGADKSGSGLGLAIAKEFIAAHGQAIAVRDGAEGGAEFIFSLEAV